jgi:hypothetical protein
MVQYFEESPLSSFSFWERSLPDISPRSSLYGLAPLGFNTLFVEELSLSVGMSTSCRDWKSYEVRIYSRVRDGHF